MYNVINNDKFNKNNEDAVVMNDINNNVENIIIEEESYKVINDSTGEEMIYNPDYNISKKSISEAFNIDKLDDSVNLEKIKNFGFGLKDDDAKCIYDLAMRIKNNETFSVYDAMTPNLQSMARNMAAGAPGQITPQVAAKDFIKYILEGLLIDKDFVDTIEAIKTEMGQVFNFSDVNNEELNEKIHKFLDRADEIEVEKPEQAKLYRDIVHSYDDAYELGFIKNILKTNGFIRKKIRKWASNNYNRIVSDFNYKYKDSDLIIKDINIIFKTLVKVFPDMDEKYIKQFIVLVSKAYQNLSPDNISDHILMYYTISNITGLVFSSDSDISKKLKEKVKNSVEEIINDLIKVEEGTYNA